MALAFGSPNDKNFIINNINNNNKKNVYNDNNNKNNINNNKFFEGAIVSPIYTFSMASNMNVYQPSQRWNREKYKNHNNYRGKNTDTDEKKKPLLSVFSPH